VTTVKAHLETALSSLSATISLIITLPTILTHTHLHHKYYKWEQQALVQNRDQVPHAWDQGTEGIQSDWLLTPALAGWLFHRVSSTFCSSRPISVSHLTFWVTYMVEVEGFWKAGGKEAGRKGLLELQEAGSPLSSLPAAGRGIWGQ
jgi:hypothetical protein